MEYDQKKISSQFGESINFNIINVDLLNSEWGNIAANLKLTNTTDFIGIYSEIKRRSNFWKSKKDLFGIIGGFFLFAQIFGIPIISLIYTILFKWKINFNPFDLLGIPVCFIVGYLPNVCGELIPFKHHYVYIGYSITVLPFLISMSCAIYFSPKYDRIIEKFCPSCIRPNSLNSGKEIVKKSKIIDDIIEIKAPRIENFDSYGRYSGFSQAEPTYIKKGTKTEYFMEEHKFDECIHCKSRITRKQNT